MNIIKHFIAGCIAKTASIVLPPKVMRQKKYFDLWQNKGYHITPVHHYEPIPDTKNFPKDIFKRKSALSGIDINENEQISLLKVFSNKYKEEYSRFKYSNSEGELDFYFGNGVFETIDAEILYCMVREKKSPKL